LIKTFGEEFGDVVAIRFFLRFEIELFVLFVASGFLRWGTIVFVFFGTFASFGRGDRGFFVGCGFRGGCFLVFDGLDMS